MMIVFSRLFFEISLEGFKETQNAQTEFFQHQKIPPPLIIKIFYTLKNVSPKRKF